MRLLDDQPNGIFEISLRNCTKSKNTASQRLAGASLHLMANPASAEITSVISICPASRTMWGMIEPLMLIRSAYPCAAPQLGESLGERHQIGRASCRERVCQYV